MTLAPEAPPRGRVGLRTPERAEQPEPRPAAASRRRRDLWPRLLIALVLVVCTVGARAPILDEPFWQDEVATARVVQKPTPRSALHQIVVRESTPPAYYMTAWSVGRLRALLAPETVPGEWLRALSLLFSIGTTLVTFVLALRLMPLWAAGLAGLLVSFGSELVFHGAELRAYSLLALTSVLFALVLLRSATRPSLPWLLALALTVAVGSLTHYFFLLTVASGIVWILWSARSRSTALRLGGAVAVALLPLLAWSPYWWRQYSAGNYSTSPHFALYRLPEVVGTYFSPVSVLAMIGPVARLAIFLLVIGSAVGLGFVGREARLCAILVLLPLGVAAGVAACGPRVFNARNLLSVAPFAAIAVAWACAAIPWHRVGRGAAVAIGILIIASFGYSQATVGRTPYDVMAREIAAQGFAGGEPLIWFGGWGGHIPVGWYLVGPHADSQSSSGLLQAAPARNAVCPAVEVVALNRTGHRWIEQHRAEVLASV